MTDELTIVEIGARRVLLLSILVLWAGTYLTKKIGFLKDFNIPAPVTGGLLCSVVVALLNGFAEVQIDFDLAMRDILLLVFFSTIGLSANVRLLVEGGKALAILLVLATAFLFFQNIVGILVAMRVEAHSLYGLLAGSVSFAGGHGTGITYGNLFADQFGLEGSVELAMACATFGIVFGGVVGGPIAKRLIDRNRLSGDVSEPAHTPHPQQAGGGGLVNMNAIINATFVITVCIGAGEVIHGWLESMQVTVPLYLPSLFVGILITNGADLFKVRRSNEYVNSVGLWSDISLTLFLSMSLMSLQLMVLSNALRPLLLVLTLQVIVMVLFAYFVVFRIMGRDYDSAVITAGFAGLGLGATPVGMANMRAITAKHGASAKAFLIVPLLGAFFIDIANAFVIQFFMDLPFVH
jgi:ESS family glutamate:Na+ symporter